MMTELITIQQLTVALNLTRYQVDAWISRGYYKPQSDPEKGKAREFTLKDAIALGTIAAFVRLGLQAKDVGPHVGLGVYGYKDDRALFAICEGPIRLSSEANAAYVEPEMAAPFSKLIPAKRLPDLLNDPEITSFAIVDLNEIETRILHALAVV
jgi:DNA-binding transcriptional MerR regulator